MGIFDIPVVKRSNDGILAAVLMILLAGLGTIIWAFIADLTEEQKKNTIIIGIIQLVLFLFIGFGWLFAIIWGILIFAKSE